MTTPPTPSHAADAPVTAPEAALETLPFPLPVAARDSLEGLALGDGFGERWFGLFRP